MLGKLEEAKLLAGGQTLIPTMKLRLASPNNIIDLNAIAAPAAVMNAITDALGTEDIAMPAMPAAVWRAIQKHPTRQAAE